MTKTTKQGAHRASRHAHIKAVGALAPLAVLSMGWTATLVAPSVPVVVAEATPAPPVVDLPDVGVELPAPASGTRPSLASRGGELLGVSVVRAVSTHGIPFAALAAYQRAAAVMDAADSACHLPWQLIAAIGRVESDHGRYGASDLDADGVASPPLIGIPLNGKRNTSAISDTDAGLLDGDVKWDRAVGPMQFIPSTWNVVGVDADGDGRRDPQDIDDAALGAAVYLCAGDGDLRTGADRAAALMRYNNSVEYAQLVLSIFAAYRAEEPVTVWTLPAAHYDTALTLNVLSAAVRLATADAGPAAQNPDAPGPAGPDAADGDAVAVPPEVPGPTVEPVPEPTPDPTPEPTPEPTPDPTPEPTPDPTPEPTPDPTPTPEPTPDPTPSPEPTTDPTTDPTPDPTTEPTTEPDPTTAPEPTTDPSGEPIP